MNVEKTYNKNRKINYNGYTIPRRGPKMIYFNCMFCKKKKLASDYSEYQQVKEGPKRCIECTGDTIKEIQCGICSKSLAVDHFSKIQRRLGNRIARCKRCIQKCREENVWDSEPDSDD